MNDMMTADFIQHKIYTIRGVQVSIQMRDAETIFHIGASLKYLCKKWFAFSKFEKGAVDVLGRLDV